MRIEAKNATTWPARTTVPAPLQTKNAVPQYKQKCTAVQTWKYTSKNNSPRPRPLFKQKMYPAPRRYKQMFVVVAIYKSIHFLPFFNRWLIEFVQHNIIMSITCWVILYIYSENQNLLKLGLPHFFWNLLQNAIETLQKSNLQKVNWPHTYAIAKQSGFCLSSSDFFWRPKISVYCSRGFSRKNFKCHEITTFFSKGHKGMTKM